MSISKEIREIVRERAKYACEFCGVKETDVGGLLTIDHFRPLRQRGSDDLSNLIYCCSRCNLYKSDYFPSSPDDPMLWDPRKSSFENHFMTSGDGRLYPLSSTGEFTIRRLRLNRPPLVAYRLRDQSYRRNTRLLEKYKELLRLQEELNKQLGDLVEEQKQLLEEQQRLLKLFLGKSK